MISLFLSVASPSSVWLLTLFCNCMLFFAMRDTLEEELDQKEDDLNAADDGEAREESHCASDETQLSLRFDLLVSLDVVKGGRVKVDPDKSEVWFNRNLNPW